MTWTCRKNPDGTDIHQTTYLMAVVCYEDGIKDFVLPDETQSVIVTHSDANKGIKFFLAEMDALFDEEGKPRAVPLEKKKAPRKSRKKAVAK